MESVYRDIFKSRWTLVGYEHYTLGSGWSQLEGVGDGDFRLQYGKWLLIGDLVILRGLLTERVDGQNVRRNIIALYDPNGSWSAQYHDIYRRNRESSMLGCGEWCRIDFEWRETEGIEYCYLTSLEGDNIEYASSRVVLRCRI